MTCENFTPLLCI